MEKANNNELSIQELAATLSCSERHLRRVFVAEYNVSLIQYLQTSRLLMAKNLVTDTKLSITEIAMAAGFGSLRRFNDLFKRKYHLSPSKLRKTLNKNVNNEITLKLNYRLPYLWSDILTFLSKRAIPEIELVKNDTYSRTVHLVTREKKHIYGWLHVNNIEEHNYLNVTISESLVSVLPEVLARLRHLFDLQSDPNIIYDTLSSMNEIIKNSCCLGTRLPGCFDPFELLVSAILSQETTLDKACLLVSKIASIYGRTIESGISELTLTFPSVEELVELKPVKSKFTLVGIPNQYSQIIYNLADKIHNQEINFDIYENAEIKTNKIMQIKRISRLTAQYIVMRTMSYPDLLFENDNGVKKALYPYSNTEIYELAENWRPWRSYATINLWNKLIKEE